MGAIITHAAMSATSSRRWKLSVINEASGSACLVDRPSTTFRWRLESHGTSADSDRAGPDAS